MDETTEIENYELERIKEGTTIIEFPKFDKVSSEAPVFYNPKMELNRDISILALQVFQKRENRDLNVCDLFGGSGIRGVRYKNEIDGIGQVAINDISEIANEFEEINVSLNGLEDVAISQNDASLFLRNNRGRFDIIDIDPFGTPSPFLDSAGYCARKNSLLCVTATDTSALCGTYKEPCIRKYNAKPYKSEYCHENGIRILAGYVALTLAKYKKYISVKLSHSTEHYMRLYIEVLKGSKATDESLENLGYVSHCKECLYRETSKGMAAPLNDTCPECGEKLVHAGPLWLGPIQDKDFIGEMVVEAENKTLNTKDKILKLLNQCIEESDGEITFYDIHALCRVLKISAPKFDLIIEKIKEKGYNAVKTHYSPLGIKTDMPISLIKDAIIELVS